MDKTFLKQIPIKQLISASEISKSESREQLHISKVKNLIIHVMQIPGAIKKIGYLLKETFNGFIDDNGIKLSAALSYYTVFSLPPLLIIIMSLSGKFFGANAVRGEIFGQINGLVGSDAALQIQETIKNVELSNSNSFAQTLGIIVLLIGASGVFAEIQDSINFIWGIKAKPKRGLIKYLYNRLMSFSMIGSVGFIPVSYTHLRAHETRHDLVCRLLLQQK